MFLIRATIVAATAVASAASLTGQTAPVVNNPAPNINAPAYRISAQPILKMGGLNDNANYEFLSIGQVDITATGKLVLIPARGTEVRVFDMRGQHLRTLGRRGQGPGEFFQAVQVMALGGDTVAVYDNLAQRVTLFNVATGNVLATMPEATNGLCCFRNATFLVSTRSGRPTPLQQATSHELISWSLASGPQGRTRADSVLTTRGNDPEIRLGRFADPPGPDGAHSWTLPAALPPFARTASAVIAGNTLVYGVSDKYEIKVFSPSGLLLRTVRVAAPEVTATRADIDAARKIFMQGADTPEKVSAYEEQYKKLTLYTTLPAFEKSRAAAEPSSWMASSRCCRRQRDALSPAHAR